MAFVLLLLSCAAGRSPRSPTALHDVPPPPLTRLTQAKSILGNASSATGLFWIHPLGCKSGFCCRHEASFLNDDAREFKGYTIQQARAGGPLEGVRARLDQCKTSEHIDPPRDAYPT